MIGCNKNVVWYTLIRVIMYMHTMNRCDYRHFQFIWYDSESRTVICFLKYYEMISYEQTTWFILRYHYATWFYGSCYGLCNLSQELNDELEYPKPEAADLRKFIVYSATVAEDASIYLKYNSLTRSSGLLIYHMNTVIKYTSHISTVWSCEIQNLSTKFTNLRRTVDLNLDSLNLTWNHFYCSAMKAHFGQFW